MNFPLPGVKRDEQGKSYVCPKCVLGWLLIIAIGAAFAFYLYRLRGT
jgi:hypothetical protein